MNSAETLNRLCGETLSITYFTSWELRSYAKNSLFSSEGCIGSVRGRTLEECIQKAVDAVRKKIHDA